VFSGAEKISKKTKNKKVQNILKIILKFRKKKTNDRSCGRHPEIWMANRDWMKTMSSTGGWMDASLQMDRKLECMKIHVPEVYVPPDFRKEGLFWRFGRKN
jgi:hypothetical protein